jgi:hypothetical protein
MGRFVDSIIAFRILKLLTTPFVDTDAFRLGIIDSKGKELKKMAQLNTTAERDAYTILHRMVFRLKKIVEKVPVENKKLTSFAAAIALVKECVEKNKEPIDLETKYLEKINCDLSEERQMVSKFMNQQYMFTFRQFMDEEGISANNAGTPGIAGFTPDTVGVSKKAQRAYRSGKKLFRRDEVKNVK